jgi:hypothetical protein
MIVIGDKYEFQEDGLLVRGITEKDNGDYVCHAEVLEMGSTDERSIKVEVHSTYLRFVYSIYAVRSRKCTYE